ncbi:ATP-dependent DNA helicase [Mycena chlorophos]|uniref:ATP-dependent DNA helicase n=1 Tax=Mycena chlorophos TaxID=658473 RepID=A0A8H6RX52_MYCCL|nr:ATP-dependent DNA helicase [Mycena chlorophos]
MWIGDVPFQLSILNLPERILIGIYFPAAFIVKLYPKKGHTGGWDKEAINSGLRGNVSSYNLNTDAIADMVAGNLMPRPLGLLAAVIAVTFVGARNIPLHILPDIFEVRRQRVHDALVWLKTHNPLYANINIDAGRLLALPDGGVPEEIYLNARYNPDASIIEREHAGYVPLDEDPDPNSVPLYGNEPDEAEERLPPTSGGKAAPLDDPHVDSDDILLDVYEPDVIPLQAHGVVDVDASDVTDADLFMHAAANFQDTAKRDYAVRKGSSFVNEYPRERAPGERFDGGPGDANHLLGAFPVLFPYGRGGFEVDRKEKVTYEAHSKWALEYEDRRFRLDHHFMFMIFGVRIKRKVGRSASMQTTRSSYIANQTAFLRLTPADFRKASEEEAQKIPISNPVIRALRRQLTADITFYITLYIAKRQIQAANASALLAKGLAIKKRLDQRQQAIKDVNKRLLQQCTNILSRQHEFSAPEVVQYVMGWGDRLISHTYAPIYWDQITDVLRKTFPHLWKRQTIARPDIDSTMIPSAQPAEEETPCRLEANENGEFVLRDQLKEYQDRGTALSAMNFYDYFTLTYHGTELEEKPDSERRGRPQSERVPYLPSASRAGCRVIRHERAEINLHFIGKWFPRADDPNTEYYSAQMLLLFRPWRVLPDLHHGHPNFAAAFSAFTPTADSRILRTIENIQYFYECSDRASERRDADPASQVPAAVATEPAAATSQMNLASGPTPTEDDILLARANRYPAREFIFGKNAIQIAIHDGIFSESYSSSAQLEPYASRATHAQTELYLQWGAQVVAFTRTAGYAMRNDINLRPADLGAVVPDDDVISARASTDPGGVFKFKPVPSLSESKFDHRLLSRFWRCLVSPSAPAAGRECAVSRGGACGNRRHWSPT